jgi:membrane-bound lytic murein transglycosylase D
MSFLRLPLALLLAVALRAGEPPAAPASPRGELPSLEALYETGRMLFEIFAPEEIKAEYEFPSREDWDAFAARLHAALQGDSLDLLVTYETEARSALVALRALPELADYADWLAERLDYIEAARLIQHVPPPAPPPATPRPAVVIPHYDLWVERIRARPVPPLAARHVPHLQRYFEAEGLPGQFVWLAEVESTFNASARSPVGARGLFQLMPETARELGLRTFFPDERTHPAKSAQAAARYLRQLHRRFDDWPLAFAAYNAGPGRVSRTLAKSDEKTFAAIAEDLPAETRMFVPKVLATLAVRADFPPEKL